MIIRIIQLLTPGTKDAVKTEMNMKFTILYAGFLRLKFQLIKNCHKQQIEVKTPFLSGSVHFFTDVRLKTLWLFLLNDRDALL
jgi:hypothetical protein